VILRGALVRVHRWIGIALGGLFALMGLTGSFNVYHRELDAWLNPAFYRAVSGEARLTLDELRAKVQAQHPHAEILNIALPVEGRPYWLWLRDEVLAQGAPGLQFQLAADPATGAIAGPRLAWGGVSFTSEALLRTMYRLHYELWAGPIGKTLVGLTGVFLFLTLVLGVSLAWPRRGAWRRVLTVKRGSRGVRALFDWHRAAGAWSAAVLAAVAFSGTYMVFPEYFHAAAKPFGTMDDLKAPVRPSGGAHAVTLEDAKRRANARYPDARVLFLAPARGEKGAIRVRLFRPGEANPFGRTFVWIDPANGAVLRAIDGRAPSAAARFFNAQFALHNGSIAGEWGRALVFAAGLLPLLLFVTGLSVWRAKRRAGRSRAMQPQAARGTVSMTCTVR
jgi:uncharacterized iron-regulated membrane protein